jgi:hypothetical protein
VGTLHYSAQPGTSDATLYTPSSNTVLTGLIAYNTGGTDRTVTVHVVRGASGQDDSIASAVSVPAGTAVKLIDPAKLALGGIVLRAADGPYAADLLKGSASAATAVTLLAFE